MSFDTNMMIDRYLDGRMNMAEQREFLRLVESNSEIRQLLELEQAIRGTMTSDRGSIPTNHARTRANTMELLSKVRPPVAPTPATPTAGTGGGAGTFAGSATTMIAVGAATIAVIVGTVFFVSRKSDVPAERSIPAVTQPNPDTPAIEAPRMNTSGSELPAAPLDTQAGESAGQSSIAPPSSSTPIPADARQARTKERADINRETNLAEPKSSSEGAIAKPKEEIPAEPPVTVTPEQKKPKPVIRRSDSVRTTIRVETDKKK